jgi:hypothetical protein
MRRRSLPEPGTLVFTPAITFIACLGERMWLVASLSLYLRDAEWALLAALAAVGSAAVMALYAFLIDWLSRSFGATIRFAIRVFGGLFLAAAYAMSYMISIVFAFHPATLMLTSPLLLAATATGIAAGIAVGPIVQAGDTGWRRLRVDSGN